MSERDCIHCGLYRESCPANAIAVRHSALEAIKIAKKGTPIKKSVMKEETT